MVSASRPTWPRVLGGASQICARLPSAELIVLSILGGIPRTTGETLHVTCDPLAAYLFDHNGRALV